MLGLIKRTCHFLVHSKRKRTLYLTMVRSQFEHCSIIWCPVTASGLVKFEAVQKNAIKWILNEESTSYSDYDTYLQKCKEVNILPISKHFDLTNLCYFHKILNCLVPTKLPDYVTRNRGNSRLRSNYLDRDSYICNLDNIGKCNSTSPIFKSYFYRTTLLWNKLPQDIRTTPSATTFKTRATQFLWTNAQKNIEIYQTI